ncbi:hypothetical protein Q3G72_000648 [Acer saccharum]|nr:hypothetical protein Q3G72_000648 [Acer saccharum]
MTTRRHVQFLITILALVELHSILFLLIQIFSSFYNCTKKPSDYYTCPIDCISSSTHYSFAAFREEVLLKANYSLDLCRNSAFVPVDVESIKIANLWQMNYTEVLKMGFLLDWTAHNCTICEASGGRYGFKDTKFVCFCTDKPLVETCYHASSCNDDHEPPHIACTRPYGCGTSTWDIWYPFWAVGRPTYCGHEGFELKCRNNPYPLIESEAQKFRVSNIDVYSATMSLVHDDLWDSYCPRIIQETNFNKNRIKYMSNVVFLDLFYDCSDEISLEGRSNSINCREGIGFYTIPLYMLQLPNVTSTCEKRIQVSVLRTALQDHIRNR